MTVQDSARFSLERHPCFNLLLQNVEHLQNGVLRLTTNMLRGDGSFVDLFIEEAESSEYKVTDFGETYAQIEYACRVPNNDDLLFLSNLHDVNFDRNTFWILSHASTLLASVLKLGQACIAAYYISERVSGRVIYDPTNDTAISSRIWTVNTVTDILKRRNISFRQNTSIELRKNYRVDIDFLVATPSSESAIMVLENYRYPKVFTRKVDHAFAVHTDLKEADWSGRRFSIISDDDLGFYSDSSSLKRLQRVSRLLPTSRLENTRMGLSK